MSCVTSLCFRLLSSRPGWEPALSSGGAGAELQHGERETIVEGSRRRRGVQFEVIQVLEIFGNGGL